MPRTEKRFGVVNQPAASTPTELVPTAATTRNILINATARSTAVISAAIYSGAYSNDANGNISITSISNQQLVSSTNLPTGFTATQAYYAGKPGYYIFASNSSNALVRIDTEANSAKYNSGGTTNTLRNYWRDSINSTPIAYREWANNSVNIAKFKNNYAMVSSTRAIGIAANLSTTATANYDMFDVVSITDNGSSLSETGNDIGLVAIQGVAAGTGTHSAGAYPLNNGFGYLLHTGYSLSATGSGGCAMGMYIYGSNSTALQKRAFWNLDGTAGKTPAALMQYFIASDYNSVYDEFAISSPAVTTLWGGISPTSSTSWPAGYAIPSSVAPGGFRIVSNSGTTDPDTNFLTGTTIYPSAPSDITLPSGTGSGGHLWTTSVKFSPDGTKLAVAYRRDYSGTGNTNSVVAIYTRQNDGSWSHTHSSGSRFPYHPDNPDAMAWSGDSSIVAVASMGTSNGQNVLPVVYFWHVANGSSGYVSNSSVNSWTVASSSYPEFARYLSPNTGSSTIISIDVSSSIGTAFNTSNNHTINSITFERLTGSSAGRFIGAGRLDGQLTAAQSFILQSRGTVGTSGQPATNYVTTTVSDLALTPGQTTQVSNIVLGSGERVYVESSTSNSVDISAHGIEST